MTDMIDPALLLAYLKNAKVALAHQQYQHAQTLLNHAEHLATPLLQQSAAPAQPALNLSYGIGLDAGKKRRGRQNEDYVFTVCGVREVEHGKTEPFGLFVVADGMGGQTRGYEAAYLATHACVDYVVARVKDGHIPGSKLQTILANGVREANRVVFERNQELRSSSGDETTYIAMGTTMNALLIVGTLAYIANVGDSRAYLWTQNQFIQITRDHSLVAELVKTGAITSQEIYTHPQRNQIYRCLGDQREVEIDMFHGQPGNEDVFLLCSDGLWEMVPEQFRIALILSATHLSPDQKAEQLVQLALDGGGADNIGLVVVQAQMNVSDIPTRFMDASLIMQAS